MVVQAQCSDCVHFFISYFKECGTCGTHLHDDGRVTPWMPDVTTRYAKDLLRATAKKTEESE